MEFKFKQKTRAPWINYIWQPCSAMVFVCMVLVCFNFVATTDLLWAVGAGALTSSAFLVFGVPSSPTGKPIKIIGGYIIGIACGLIVRLALLSFFTLTKFTTDMPHFRLLGIMAAITVGISLLIMTLFKVDHPPAAGMSLVLVIDIQQYDVLGIIFSAAIILACLRMLLANYLYDL